MLLNIENNQYDSDDILYINTAYKIMGLYVIEIYFKAQEDPLVLQYNDKINYDKVVGYLKKSLSII